MDRVIKLILLVILLAVAARGYQHLRAKRIAEESSPDHKMDATDLMIGRGDIQRYLDIKKNSPEFNLPALKTAMMQFHINKGRFPQNLAELETDNLAGRDLTHDRFGQPYHLKYEGRTALLTSPGEDKQAGTEDDIKLTLALQ
ncbi:MAG: hypothetical protein ABIH23_10935 [bacterium]